MTAETAAVGDFEEQGFEKVPCSSGLRGEFRSGSRTVTPGCAAGGPPAPGRRLSPRGLRAPRALRGGFRVLRAWPEKEVGAAVAAPATAAAPAKPRHAPPSGPATETAPRLDPEPILAEQRRAAGRPAVRWGHSGRCPPPRPPCSGDSCSG